MNDPKKNWGDWKPYLLQRLWYNPPHHRVTKSQYDCNNAVKQIYLEDFPAIVWCVRRWSLVLEKINEILPTRFTLESSEKKNERPVVLRNEKVMLDTIVVKWKIWEWRTSWNLSRALKVTHLLYAVMRIKMQAMNNSSAVNRGINHSKWTMYPWIPLWS